MQHDDASFGDDADIPLSMRCRLAYIAGAEDHSWETMGRPLTLLELWEIIARYPGDPADVPERERPG